MKANTLIIYSLWALVLFGFVSVANVSWANFNGSACPSLLSMPVCYIVMFSYGLMLGSLMVNHKSCKHHFFCLGWGVAFVIALLASLTEMFSGGGICPLSSGGHRFGAEEGIPLCYVSLVILFVILILFIKGPYQKVCENDKP